LDSVRGVYLQKASIRHGLDEMRKEYGYEDANPLERLLIEQVILTWLHFHMTQRGYECTLKEGTTIRNADCW